MAGSYRGSAIYVAMLSGDKVNVQRISPEDQNPRELTVALSGRVLWSLGDWRVGDPLRTVSYPDMKVRTHPRYEGQGILLSPDGRTLTYFSTSYAVSDEGRRLALGAEEERQYRLNKGRMLRDIVLEEVDTGKERVYSDDWVYVEKPTWSPDSQWLAFYSRKRSDRVAEVGVHVNFYAMNASDGSARKLAGPWKPVVIRSHVFFRKPTWTAASDRVLFGARFSENQDSNKTYLVPVSGAGTRELVSEYACIGASPDNNSVYIYEPKSVFELKLKEKKRHAELARCATPWAYSSASVSPTGRWMAYYLDTVPGGIGLKRVKGPQPTLQVREGKPHQGRGPFYWVNIPEPEN